MDCLDGLLHEVDRNLKIDLGQLGLCRGHQLGPVQDTVARIHLIDDGLHVVLQPAGHEPRDRVPEQAGHDVDDHVAQPIGEDVAAQAHVNVADRRHLEVLHEDEEVKHIDHVAHADHHVLDQALDPAPEDAQAHHRGHVVVAELRKQEHRRRKIDDY